MALDRDPVTLDPAEVRDGAGRLVVDAVYDSLTTMAEDLTSPRPSAALRWSVSPDDLTWTFTLRTGARWHDGRPVVASDFVRAYRHLAAGGDGRTFNRHLLEPLLHEDGQVHVAAPDDATVVITLPAPVGDLPVLLSDPALAPRPAGTLDREQPVGNGPFAMREPWAHNQFIRLAPMVGHHAAPRVDEVLLPIYAQTGSGQVQYQDFRAQALDVSSVPVEEVAAAQVVFGDAEEGAGPGVINDPRTTTTYLGFDTTSPPFDSADARRAVSLLLDRDVLVAQVGQHARLAATGIVSPGIPGAGQADCDHCRRDLAASLELFDEVEPPQAPLLLLAPDDDASRRLAEYVATAMRGGLDVEVEVRTRPLASYAGALAGGAFDLFVASWTATRPSMGGFLVPMLSADADTLDNPGRIDLPEIEAALEDAGRATITAQRRAAWARAEQVALDQAVISPLYHPRLHTVVDDDVSGFVLRPDGLVNLAQVSVPAD